MPIHLHSLRCQRVLHAAALAVALSAQPACYGPSESTGGDPLAAPASTAAPAPAPPPSPVAPAPAPAPAPTAAATGGRCGRLTAAEIASTLGIAALKEARPIGEGPVTVCQYSDGRSHGAVRIYHQSGASKSGFANAKKAVVESKQKPTPISGLGEAAFSTTTRTPDKEFNTIVFLHKGVQTSISAPVPLAKVKLLARQLITKP